MDLLFATGLARHASIACFGIWLVSASPALAAPPVNDQFAGRIHLVGNSNVFTAVLDEATLGNREVMNGHLGVTVWYSWTATESTPVVLEVTDAISTPPGYAQHINVLSPTNLNGFPTNDFPVWPIAQIRYVRGTLGAWTTFMAESGRSYQVQVCGNYWPSGSGLGAGTLKLRLIAQARPLITESPISQTLQPGGSALFGVIAAGVLPLSYRWYRDGFDLLATNAPIFTLAGVSEAMTGGYSVIVSNVYGCSTSSVATLQVVTPPVPPSLTFAAARSNRFEFVLSGQSNVFYRIESTTNGVAWTPASEFPRDLFGNLYGRTTSIIRSSDSRLAISTGRDSSTLKLFRASLYVPQNHECNNNLRRLQYTKRLWARQFHKDMGWDVPGVADVTPYFERPDYPQCPAGGRYAINALGTWPTCESGHLLEEVWPE